MESNKQNASKNKSRLGHVIGHCLALVRGPFFLSAISLSLLLIIPAAQATLLKGYISSGTASTQTADGSHSSAPVAESTAATSEGQAAAAGQAPAPGLVNDDSNKAADNRVGKSEAPVLESPAESAMHRRIAHLQSVLSANSFPTSFEGAWHCVTTVVGSGVTTVPVGQMVQSEVHFLPAADGRVVAEWHQPGWTEGREQISALSDHEASLTRTNYYVSQGAGEWAACSHDHYLQVGTNRMVASSRVEQFDGEQFLGSYTTRSVLYRLSDDISLVPEPNQ
jgi:hypothetical protein